VAPLVNVQHEFDDWMLKGTNTSMGKPVLLLHICKNVPAWGLHSIEGEDVTPCLQQTLTARRNSIYMEYLPLLILKIKKND
jgi:hypothetical protein